MGIAIGSFVAAALSIGLLWGVLTVVLRALGGPLDIGGPLSPGATYLLALGSFLTGGLIYRDILRRERRP
jgi:hypothetical protein